MDTLCAEKFFEWYICKSLCKRLHETLTIHGTECTLAVIVKVLQRQFPVVEFLPFTQTIPLEILSQTGRGGRMTRYKVNPNQIGRVKKSRKITSPQITANIV